MAKYEDIEIHFDTQNAAFEDSPTGEIARILRDIASRFERGDVGSWQMIRDINGNTVGELKVKSRESDDDEI